MMQDQVTCRRWGSCWAGSQRVQTEGVTGRAARLRGELRDIVRGSTVHIQHGLGIESQAWHLDESVSFVGVSNIADVKRDTGLVSPTRDTEGASRKLTIGDYLKPQETQLVPTVKVCPFTTRQMNEAPVLCLQVTASRKSLPHVPGHEDQEEVGPFHEAQGGQVNG